MREQRKLAAVLAADVCGYSRLMARDEAGTLARLKEHRAQHFEPALARNGGRLVKLTGDGVLAEFGSAVDALRAAIEFQQAVDQANAMQPEEPDQGAIGVCKITAMAAADEPSDNLQKFLRTWLGTGSPPPISAIRERMLGFRKVDVESYAAALRKAGLPE